MESQFLAEKFYNALDDHRIAKKITWKKVAEQAKVSASTLTRIAQGRRPDVDTMAALCIWAKLNADDYVNHINKKQGEIEQLPQIVAHLRADKNISAEGAKAIEIMIKSAYEQFRLRQKDGKKE